MKITFAALRCSRLRWFKLMAYARRTKRTLSSCRGFINHCKTHHLFWIQLVLACTALCIVLILHTSLSSEQSDMRTARDNKIIEQMMAQKIQPKDKTILMDLVKQFVKLADELDLVYFMSSGTLIGSWRHHGMITWDDDVDILVDETQKGRLIAAVDKMEPHYFGQDTDPIFKFYSKESTEIKGRSWRWPFIDICFFRQNAEEIWDTLAPLDVIKLKKSRIFPVHKRPFEQFQLNAPKDSLYYFEKTYQDLLTKCQSHALSHELERGGKTVLSLHCGKLSNLVPFVHRRVLNGKMEETLILRDRVLNIRYVEEDPINLSGPYELRRSGYLPWIF